MDSSPLVSVVIPCFNHAHFLAEAIESVENQTYRNFEIIVVNDGSTDNSSDVVREFESVRLVEQQNQGLSASRNNGLAVAAGEYVVFLDSDDRLLPGALEIGAKALGDNPRCVFASGFCQRISVEGESLLTIQPKVEDPDPYLNLLKKNYIWAPSNVIYRRSVFEKTEGFDTSQSPTADFEMYLRLARRFKVFHHGSVVTQYRQHPSSMSRDHFLMLKSILNVLDNQKQFVSENSDYKRALKHGLRWNKVYYLGLVTVELIKSLKQFQFSNALGHSFILLKFPMIFPRVFIQLVLDKLEVIEKNKGS